MAVRLRGGTVHPARALTLPVVTGFVVVAVRTADMVLWERREGEVKEVLMK
jgi:hypothetical protein